MPEGDTVHRTAKRLALLDGEVLERAELRIPSLIDRDLVGRTVLETAARGKHLLTRLSGGISLHSHLKMEGSWSVDAAGARWRKPAHTARAVLVTDAHQAVGFQIVLDLIETGHEDSVVGHLGPDLLGADWDPQVALTNLLAHPNDRIADALLDQRNLAGIGNVYKSELCFLSGVSPATPVHDVPNPERLVALAKKLLEANKDRGNRVTTGIDQPGRRLWVYGRKGPCLRCGTPVRRAEMGVPGQERITYWCPSCQPGP